MRLKQWLSLLIVFLLLGVSVSPAFAATLKFQVPKDLVNLYVNTDGTVTVEYTIDLVNIPGDAPIDYIDIGAPNSNFSYSDVSAEINGQPITDIGSSPYLESGVALGLGAGTIQPGGFGQLHVVIANIGNMFFTSSAKGVKDYAAFEFMPNYFGSEYVDGSTDLTVTIFLPPGLNSDEPRWHTPSNNWPGASDPQSGYDQQGRVYYSWQSSGANSSSKYVFGSSFPMRLIPPDVVQKPNLWQQLGIDPAAIVGIGIVCCIGFFVIGLPIISIINARKRKLQYLPPRISVEGHGIKRGLTAVEAAILMEQPMDKIMTMILFAAVKKSAATVVTRDPLKITAAAPQPEGLQPYETQFIQAFQAKDKAAQRAALQEMMVGLVKSVSEKMKGFSRKETVDYYKSITETAWKQVEAANTPEVKSQKFDEVMDWTLLDKKYEDRTNQTFGSGPVFVPIWWNHYDPTYRPATTAPTVSTGSAPSMPTASRPGGGLSMPHLPGSDFAASIANGVSSFSAGVIGDITSFTSGVTNKTNPVPVSTASSRSGGSSRGGGGGCACACACAGCACACAGGGR